MKTEFDFSLCEFNRNNPTFLEILRKNVMVYDKEMFEYFSYIFFRNISNFTDSNLYRLEKYIIDLHKVLSMNTQYNKGIYEIESFYYEIENTTIYEKKYATEIHNEILPKISDIFTNKKKTMNVENKFITCPLRYIVISKNWDELDNWDDEELYVKFWELRKWSRISHYYLMVYVFDLTLKMQKIKSELFKYEFARKGVNSGTALDIIINELFVEYLNLNKEFKIYLTKMNRITYYNDSILMYANNINIMCIYEKKLFDFDRNLPKSVIDEKNTINVTKKTYIYTS